MIELSTLDPAAPLDDLEPLREIVGAARVVGLGESAHYVREYQLLRHRLVRFLVERMGFSVLALESGFSEGLAVGEWIRGGPGEVAEIAGRGLTYRLGLSPESHAQLTWAREAGLAYYGLDLPGDLASMLPALESLDRYLVRVDPGGGDPLDRARQQAQKWAGAYTMPAFAAYGELEPEARDAQTVALAELAARFDAQRPFYVSRAGAEAFAIARHELRLAGLLDQMLRAQLAGAGLNVRDAAMASTAAWLLDGGTGRIVIGAANNHLQRVPVMLGGTIEVPVLGCFLAADLGDDYLAVGLTCGGGRTPSRRAAPGTPSGAELVPVELEPPAEGSIEAALGADRHGPGITDLRPRRSRTPGPSRIRVMDSYLDIPVVDAFDAIATVPTITTTEPVT
jgi:erythromycin esterase